MPEVGAAAKRAGIATGATVASATMVRVIKTFHGGRRRLSLARVLCGTLKDGAVLHGAGGDARVGSLALSGDKQVKKSEARAGDTVALARLDNVQTGDLLSSDKAMAKRAAVLNAPVYRLAIEAADRKDEVKVTAAIGKLIEEDPSLVFEQIRRPRKWCWPGRARFA